MKSKARVIRLVVLQMFVFTPNSAKSEGETYQGETKFFEGEPNFANEHEPSSPESGGFGFLFHSRIDWIDERPRFAHQR